ncbi:MAG: shikimate dehydrogenase [Pirellulales bacterium]|nr:shikimate dehydrogenase [Pirellulales bacterium]
MAAINPSLQPILALMGHPVGGNPTQYMTEKAFLHRELDWRYLTLDVSPDELPDALRGMKAMGFRGGNLIDPHKESAVDYLDRATKTAELTGIVNLIRRDEEDLVGENTEGLALIEALAMRISLVDKQVCLLGAGHMARAVGVELAQAHVGSITIINRTQPHAADLAALISDKLKVSAQGVGWSEQHMVDPETDILINATSIADSDPDTRIPLALDSLTPDMLVVDTTIDPSTLLLAAAKDRGCSTLDGVEILIDQAAINFKLWTDIEADRTVLREAVEEYLEL